MIDIAELAEELDRYAEALGIDSELWKLLTNTQKVRFIAHREIQVEWDKPKKTKREMADITSLLGLLDGLPEILSDVPHDWGSLDYTKKGKYFIRRLLSQKNRPSDPAP